MNFSKGLICKKHLPIINKLQPEFSDSIVGGLLEPRCDTVRSSLLYDAI